MIGDRDFVFNYDFRVVNDNPLDKGTKERLLLDDCAFAEKAGEVLHVVFEILQIKRQSFLISSSVSLCLTSSTSICSFSSLMRGARSSMSSLPVSSVL